MEQGRGGACDQRVMVTLTLVELLAMPAVAVTVIVCVPTGGRFEVEDAGEPAQPVKAANTVNNPKENNTPRSSLRFLARVSPANGNKSANHTRSLRHIPGASFFAIDGATCTVSAAVTGEAPVIVALEGVTAQVI